MSDSDLITKYNNSTIKSGIWYTAISIVTRGISIITIPIFTRLLSSEDFGVVSIFSSWLIILQVFISFSLIYSVGVGLLDYNDFYDEFISSVQIIMILSGLVWFFFSIIFLEQIKLILDLDIFLVLLLFGALILSPSVDLLISKFRYTNNHKPIVLIQLSIALITPLLSIILIFISKDNLYNGRILGIIIPSIIFGAYSVIYNLVKGKFTFDFKYMKYALKISIPMIPHALAMILLSQIDRIMIQRFFGFSEAGIYSFGYTFASLINIVIISVGSAWVPWFNKSLQLKEYNKIKKTNINLLIFIGIISIFFVTTTPEIIKLLSTQEYYSAKWIVAPIVLGTIAQFSYGFYSTLELFHKKTIYISVNTLLIALINILLNWLLIPKYGFFAAAYTTYISYILLVCLHYFTVKWILKIDIYKKNSSFFLIQGIFFLFSTVIVFLYDYVLIRYSFFFIAFFIFYILNSRNINMIISNFYNIFFTRQVKE